MCTNLTLFPWKSRAWFPALNCRWACMPALTWRMHGTWHRETSKAGQQSDTVSDWSLPLVDAHTWDSAFWKGRTQVFQPLLQLKSQVVASANHQIHGHASLKALPAPASSWHPVEQKQAVPSQPHPNGRFMSKLNVIVLSHYTVGWIVTLQ